MMQFVDYELAMLLKEKGYNEGCDGYYHIVNNEVDSMHSFELTGDNSFDFFNEINQHRVGAPRIAMVIDWLFYKHNIHITTSCGLNDTWRYVIMHTGDNPTITVKGFKNRNEAYCEGIKYVLKEMI